MSDINTLADLLTVGQDDSTALGAPGQPSLTYKSLRTHVAQTVATLNYLGIGRNDRVAIVLPNGPLMASAFVSIGAGATTAPLNPGYRQAEFEFYLADLGAKALVVEEGSRSPAVAVAAALNIPVLEVVTAPDALAGQFDLRLHSAAAPGTATNGGMAEADDIALVLHTSGTTSRPKIVPLTHRNVCMSARNVAASLALTADDRCLNIMPLFHIHGLIAAVLATLRAGASVICTPGFDALQFYGWLESEKPTWYTAVPTMQRARCSSPSTLTAL